MTNPHTIILPDPGRRPRGRIGACERLLVETGLSGCRVLMVAAGGVFRGGADVETADIGGTVEGSLTETRR